MDFSHLKIFFNGKEHDSYKTDMDENSSCKFHPTD